jgi:hypothetical protein
MFEEEYLQSSSYIRFAKDKDSYIKIRLHQAVTCPGTIAQKNAAITVRVILSVTILHTRKTAVSKRLPGYVPELFNLYPSFIAILLTYVFHW